MMIERNKIYRSSLSQVFAILTHILSWKLIPREREKTLLYRKDLFLLLKEREESNLQNSDRAWKPEFKNQGWEIKKKILSRQKTIYCHFFLKEKKSTHFHSFIRFHWNKILRETLRPLGVLLVKVSSSEHKYSFSYFEDVPFLLSLPS